ncbi:hypothetical protein [Paenibacillus urinalis]|uniref:hypothetical protein n=1 Tax=Paenibacillus urinalis TaxID=521520 RepID=UPI0019607F41
MNGKLDEFTSQLSARIWGHRFKSGQRGPEYTLEFLNVLYGTNYSFEKGKYKRKKSVELRKFIFEGMKQGRIRDVVILEDEEKQKIIQAVNEENVIVLKQFLRNLEIPLFNTLGKEADRSWFARSLNPLHESLLFFELRKHGNSLAYERNFYARGGELYFLMLFYGTEDNIIRRKFIEDRFKYLLTKNRVIGKVVNKITSVFEEENEEQFSYLRQDSNTREVPILPDPEGDKDLFERFSYEVEKLLSIDIDMNEMFKLLTSLICFQLTRYMHYRANLTPEKEGYANYFFDCLENNKIITQLSSRVFDEHENLIKTKFESEFMLSFQSTIGQKEDIAQHLEIWKLNPDKFISLLGLSKMRSRKEVIISNLKKCNNYNDVITRLYPVVKDAVSDQLKKDQLNINRVLTRDGGFSTYRRGSASNYRYTISDHFLQMLVYTTVKPGEKMEYNVFLNKIWADYNVVIGESEAKLSGIYETSNLNIRYFQDNEKSLRNKLRQNGLLIEFSDATAMIQNPYSSSKRLTEALTYA